MGFGRKKQQKSYFTFPKGIHGHYSQLPFLSKQQNMLNGFYHNYYNNVCYGTVVAPVGQFSSLWRSVSAQIGALQLIRIQWFSVLLIVSRADACWHEALNKDHPVEGWCSPHVDLQVCICPCELSLRLINLKCKKFLSGCDLLSTLSPVRQHTLALPH